MQLINGQTKSPLGCMHQVSIRNVDTSGLFSYTMGAKA